MRIIVVQKTSIQLFNFFKFYLCGILFSGFQDYSAEKHFTKLKMS